VTITDPDKPEADFTRAIRQMRNFRKTVAGRKRFWWIFAILMLAAHAVWAYRSGQIVHFQRGGALLTVFAFVLLFFTRGLPELGGQAIAAISNLAAGTATADPELRITGNTILDTQVATLASRIKTLRNDILRTQILAEAQNVQIALIGGLGTLIWGYGDLLACLPFLHLNGCPG
jgi:hypothetical protein